MDQPFYLREQAERCRRLARDSTDPSLRDRLPKLAREQVARASAQANDERAVLQAGSDDEGAA
jgi:hypothetical protein